MDPVAHEWLFSCNGLTLCDFAFVVRENIVLATGMNVDLISKERATHRGTLDVPSREPLRIRLPFWTIGRWPSQNMVRIITDAELPECEVRRMPLLLVYIDACSGLYLIEYVARERAIGRGGFRCDIEVDAIVCRIRVPALQ